MAKEIDLTIQNLRTLGLLGKGDGTKEELIIDDIKGKDVPIKISTDAIKQEVEIAGISPNGAKQEVEISDTTKEPKYKDIYNEDTNSKIPFNEADNVFISVANAGAKVGSPDLTNMLEEHLEAIDEAKKNSNNAAASPSVTSITSPKEPIDITLDNDFEVTYKKLYNEVSATISKGLGEGEEVSAEEVTERLNDLMYRNKYSSLNNELEIFLYNVFPYVGANLVQSVTAMDPSNPISLFRIGSGILRFLSVIRYFTVPELILYLGSNFYTMHFIRGISVKKEISSFFSTEMNGDPDLFFGRPKGWLTITLANINKFFISLFTTTRKIGAGNTKLTEYKDGKFHRSPNIELNRSEAMIEIIKQDEVLDLSRPDPLDATNPGDITFKDPRQFKITYASIVEENGKWKVYNGETEKISANLNDVQYRKSFLQSSNEFKGPTDKAWNDAQLITYYRMQAKDDETGWKANGDYGNGYTLEKREEVTPESAKSKTRASQIAGNPLLSDVMFVNLNAKKMEHVGLTNEIKGRGISKILPDDYLNSPNMNGLLFSDAVKNKHFLNRDGKWQIGAVYVLPIYADDINPFFIPFEFNPMIDEGGLSASYQATEYLARVGTSQSYTKTTLPTVTISTKYFAVSHDTTIESLGGHGWMNHFTLPKIQAIELAYRSLVMPTFPEDERTIETGYKYIKPPLIKIVMGNANDKTNPYAGLLTYESYSGKLIGNKLKSLTDRQTLKTFVITEVSIKKDLAETPAYLDKDLTFRDVFGYEISMTLAEVTASYMDLYPDFRNYYDSYIELYDADKKAITGAK